MGVMGADSVPYHGVFERKILKACLEDFGDKSSINLLADKRRRRHPKYQSDDHVEFSGIEGDGATETPLCGSSLF